MYKIVNSSGFVLMASKTVLVPKCGKKQSGKIPTVLLGKHC